MRQVKQSNERSKQPAATGSTADVQLRTRDLALLLALPFGGVLLTSLLSLWWP